MVSVDAPTYGPCSPWAAISDVDALGIRGELNPDHLQIGLTVASEVLFNLSGQQFTGTCEATVRPCCSRELGSADWETYGYPYRPELVAGVWYNVACGGDPCVSWDCGGRYPAIDLGQYPVTAVTAVKIDGTVFPYAAGANWRLDGWRHLVRTDGDLWPLTQNLLLPDTEVGTWSVAIAYGDPAPQMAINAAAELGTELTHAIDSREKCRLPLNVVNVTRQGVSYSLANVMDAVKEGRTGLYYVDLFLASVNPERLQRRPRVLTPEMQAPRRLGST